MSTPNENPLTPESWQADGIKGASAKAGGQGDRQDSEIPRLWRWLARTGLGLAAWSLDRYALITDMPAPGSVEAADLIAAAFGCISLEFAAPAEDDGSGGEA